MSLFPMLLAGFESESIPVVAIVGGVTIALVSIVLGSIKQIIQSREREKTRREVAAYVAEGSITPADGERLLTAGKRPRSSCDSGDADA